MIKRRQSNFWNERFDEQVKRLPKKIPFLGGRPEREDVISDDDIMNLRITLETTNDI
jgi:hypothetical protein